MKFLSHPFLRVASFVFIVVSATSAATLSDVSATPLEDGQVRLVYTVDGTADETFRVELSGLNQEDGSDIELKSLSGTDLSQRLSPGTYTNLWDAAADFPTNRTERFVVQATLLGHESATADYVVLDLSTNTYPVSTLDAVPDGGWTDEYKTSKMVFRRIEAGTFTMGSPSGEIGRNQEETSSETQHSVTLIEPFYLAVFPCTQGQYRRIAGSNPAKAAQGETLPVDSVSYVTLRGASQGAQWPTSSAVDATSFFGRLNARSGQTFDLPTEAQWEYACRATTTTALNSGKNLSSANQDANMAAVGRYEGNRGGNATAAVGSYVANTWGLYDMHGNVLEWCLDRYSLSMSSSAATDPVGPTSGTLRVCRGGAWSSPASQCRSAARIYAQPSAAGNNYGFRVLCKNAWQDAAPVTLLSAEVTVDTLPPPPPPPPPDPIPLAEAADTTNLVWTSSDWFGQTNVVKVNDSALQSGAIGDNKKSTVSTTVNGAGTLSFWWKTSSHKNDYVKFYVDGAATSKRLSGDSDWAQVTYVVESAAKHTFSWTYEKDSSNTNGMDCAWLDGVVWTPAMSLGEALDCTNLVWTTSGDAPWYGEPNTGAKKDGDLAISGLLGDDGKSILSTTIPEAGTLTFSWKLSKANTFDSISFLVDGNEEDYTDSATWATRSFHFDGGEEVEWNFYKYEADETGAERAYVDDVVWTPDYIPPEPDPIPLAEAADSTNLVWTSSDWFGQTNMVKVNDSALQSGLIGDDGVSTLTTTVNGEGALTFWWRTSSEETMDRLQFFLDGTGLDSVSGIMFDWEQKTIQVTGETAHTLAWKYMKSSSNTNGQDCAWLDGIAWTPAMSLAEAVDCTNLVWSTDGDAPWFGEPGSSAKSDGDYAIGGILPTNGFSRLSSTVTGPGTLSFSWKVVCPAHGDILELRVDDEVKASINGTTANWTTFSFDVAEGDHMVDWIYWKDQADATGKDRGYVDAVVWSPVLPEPEPEPELPSLTRAVDGVNLALSSTGDAPWFVIEGTDLPKGDYAAQSGAIDDVGISEATATVNGPGTLTFSWSVSSEADFDKLQFFLDGQGVREIVGDVAWTDETIVVTGSGAHTFRWCYNKSQENAENDDCGWLDDVVWTPALTLAEALDCTNLVWSIDGDMEWFPATANNAHNDGDYARSGILEDSETSLLSTELPESGLLSFWWKVDSTKDCDTLYLKVDGKVCHFISGQIGWAQVTVTNDTDATLSVEWVYTKDEAGSDGADCAYVDDVVWSPVLPEPEPEPELPSPTRAVDAINLVLTNANGSAWFVQTNEVHTGDSALRSGAISDGEISMVAASASGPGTLSFWWKVSSEADADKLQFLVREKTFSGVPVDSGDVGYREISGEQDWVQVTLTYTTDVVHSFLWQYNKSAANSDGADCGWLDDVTWTPTLTLAEALDAPGLPWSPENAAGAWTGEKSKDSAKNDNRAVSGYVEDGETSDLATTFAGSGVLSFSWKVSSTRNADTLYLYVDGEIRRFISGDTGWMLVEEAIAGDGDHTVVWSYEKDETDAEGLDRAYLDNVVWEPKSVLSMAPGPGRLALAPKKAMQTFAFSDIAVNGDGTISVALEADVYGSGGVANGLYAMVKTGLGSSQVYVLPGTLSVHTPPELPVLTFAVPDGVEGLFVVGVCDAEEIELKKYPAL